MIALLWDMVNAHARNCAIETLAGRHDRAKNFATMYAETLAELRAAENLASVSQ